MGAGMILKNHQLAQQWPWLIRMDTGPNAGKASWKLLAEPGVTSVVVRLWEYQGVLEEQGVLGHGQGGAGALSVLEAVAIFYSVLSTTIMQPYL